MARAKLYKHQSFHPFSRKQSVLNQIFDGGHDALLRQSTFITEIIWGRVSRMFPSKAVKSENDIFRKRLFLFNMVRLDAANFLKKNKTFKLPKEYRASLNPGRKKLPAGKKIIYTDLNHAYWRIAFNLGVITEKTYKKGLPRQGLSDAALQAYKQVSLASLSTLGAGKKYNIIRNGEITNEIKHINENPQLAAVYKLIRFNCYWYMTHLMRLLGDDFIKYETDAIFYINTPNNVRRVENYLRKKKLLFTHVIE